MSRTSKMDLSNIAPHRRAEIVRRIEILENYIGGGATRAEAVAQLGMSEGSFYNLLRAWRHTGRPDALVGTGRPQNRVTPTDEQRRLIRDAEAGSPTGSLSAVIARAERLAELRGVELPGVRTMKVLIGEIRRARSLRPDGVLDVIVTHCAVNLPARAGDAIVMPVLGLVLAVGRRATILGASLSLSPPDAYSSARAILDALSSADAPYMGSPAEFRVMAGPEGDWSGLKAALDDTDLPLIFTPARPRSWREVTGLIGDRPTGLMLMPDVTSRPAEERTVKVPKGGSDVALEDAEAMVRGRLKGAFEGSRGALLANDEARTSLARRLETLVADQEPSQHT